MFSRIIYETAFANQFADSFFKRITSDCDYRNDRTFLSTLRALLADRIPEGDELRFRYRTADSLPSNLEDWSYLSDRFEVVDLTKGSVDDTAAILAGCGKFKEIEKIHGFFATTANVRCFVNEENKASFFLTDQIDRQRWHYYQCSILPCLPWYFPSGSSVSDDEMKLLQSLRGDNADEYLVALATLSEKYDMKSEFIKAALEGFETDRLEQQKVSLEARLRSINQDIDQLFDDINEKLRAKSDDNIRLQGILCEMRKPRQSTLADYFAKNPNIEFEEFSGGYLTFSCRAPATYWEEDVVEGLLNNPDSYLYVYGGRQHDEISDGQMRMLMTAIFIDREIKLNLCATYQIASDSCYAISGHNYSVSPKFADCMPNPHIYHHGCMDGHRKTVYQYLCRGDYIPAIEQCIASCGNLNFNDAIVTKEMMGAMYGARKEFNMRAFVLPDGSVVDQYGAIKYLEERG